MKIIEAMRRIKIAKEQVASTKDLIQQYCADYDVQDPTYPDQAGQIRAWLDKIHDTLELIEDLKHRIAKKNVTHQVGIKLGDKEITKSIYQWIERRDRLAAEEWDAWKRLTNRGLATNQVKAGPDGQPELVRVRLYFDPKLRDAKVSLFSAEKHLIDGTLEVVNAAVDID